MISLYMYSKKSIEKIRVSLAKSTRIENTILVAGVPRAGTTWLMELLGSLPSYLTLFEPLHNEWFPLVKKYGFKTRTYINPSAESTKKREYLKLVFEGKIVGNKPHINIRETPGRFFFKNILGKCVRANRILPWIMRNFKLRGCIFIIRNPYATIASQFKRQKLIKDHHLFDKDQLINDASNIDIIPEKILDELYDIKNKEEIIAATWAIDHYVPLYFKKEKNYIPVIYEKLFINGESELRSIFSALGFQEVPYKAYKKLISPSRAPGSDPIINKKQDQLNKWKNQLSQIEIENIQRVLEIFGTDFYNEGVLPNCQKLEKWKGY